MIIYGKIGGHIIPIIGKVRLNKGLWQIDVLLEKIEIIFTRIDVK